MSAFAFKANKRLFLANTRDGIRTYVNQGGTSSGKTYTILNVLMYYAISENRQVITVCGQDLPNLKVGAFRDAKTIIGDSEWLCKFFSVNESGHYLEGLNGSIIEFKSYDNAQDAKNGKRDYLFINEANGVSYDIYWQLAIRTRKKVYIDYNPTSRFWVHDEVIGKPETAWLISNHHGNPFLTEDEHKRIENISDPELYRVYALGYTGKVSGLILTNYDIVDRIPAKDEWKTSAYGLDWGFVNDPTSLVFFCLAHGELWVDEIIYETGMTNPDIAQRMRYFGLTRYDLVIADSAEEKSIAEIRNMGFWLMPCTKGKDSIVNGIDILKRYKIHVTRRSRGLLDELTRYSWDKDRDGRTTNKPIDKYNHSIDALRYAVSAKLAERPSVRTKGHLI